MVELYDAYGDVINSNSNYIHPVPDGYELSDLFSPVVYNPETSVCEFRDCLFTNLNMVTEVSQHFKKYGCYTKLHPVQDKYEYREFWDREERRRRNGIVLPGGAVVKENGVYVTKKIWITGEHYGYLNYGRIDITSDTDDAKSILGLKTKKRQKVRDFPKFWDWDFVYFHGRFLARLLGKHMCVGKARRKGYSYKNGWCAANRYDLIPGRATIIGAHLLKYITKGSGMMKMAKDYINFLNIHTDWAKGRLNDTVDYVKSGYKLEGENEERGFLSQIFGLSFDQSADSAIGKDADEVYLDECGSFPNLSEVLDVTIPTMEDGDFTTGMLTAFGTGGTKNANWEPFERVFYNPNQYNMLAFENIFENEHLSYKTAVSFFHPYYKNLTPYIDENGNSLDEVSKEISKRNFAEKSKNESDPEKLTLWRGQRADKPSQAFVRSASNYFYTVGLERHYTNLLHDSNLYRARRFGVIENGKFIETDKHPPIDRFPARDIKDFTGCYVEFSPLYRDPATGKVPPGLYRAWHDPYDTDKTADKINLRNSLGVTYIYERINNITATRGNILKGIYVGRPFLTDDYNRHLFEILEYSNAQMLFENDRGQVIPYAKRIKATHRLVEEPSMDWAKEFSGRQGRGFGISIGDNSGLKKRRGAQLLRDWLYTPVTKDSDGNQLYVYNYITDLGTLEELLSWNLLGNFDRVSALIVGMFDLQESLYIPYDKQDEVDNDEQEFFNRPWY